MAVRILICAKVDSGAKHAGVDVFVKDFLGDRQGFFVFLGQVQVVHHSAVGSVVPTVDGGEGVCDSLGVGGHVDLGDDGHADLGAVLHKGLVLLLGVVVVLGGQGSGGVCFLLEVALQTERGIGPLGVFIAVVVLQEDEVVVEVDMEVVHLVPGHVLGDLPKLIHAHGLAAHVQNKAAHLVCGVVADGALGDGHIAAELEGLEKGAGGPVRAGGVGGEDGDMVGDLNAVGLIIEAGGFTQIGSGAIRKDVIDDDVAGLNIVVDLVVGGISMNMVLLSGHIQVKEIVEVVSQFIGHVVEAAGCAVAVNDAAVGGESKLLTVLCGGGIPLHELGNDGGLGVALVCGMLAGDGHPDGGIAGGGGRVAA